MPDAEKYRSLYDEVYRRMLTYGTAMMGSGAVDYVAGLLNARHGATLLDVGAGKHRFAAEVKRFAPSANIYSSDISDTPAPDGIHKLVAPAWDLSGVPGDIDVLTAFDLLEHLDEDDLHYTLDVWNKTVRGEIVISVGTSKSRVPDGLWPNSPELHRTIRKRDWWFHTLEKYFVDLHALPGPRHRFFLPLPPKFDRANPVGWYYLAGRAHG